MKSYLIKFSLKGISPLVWRRLRISGNTSLDQLHRVIQTSYHWEDEYLHRFHMRELFTALRDADDKTTVGDIRALIEAVYAVQFNRHYLNHRRSGEYS